MSSILCQLGGPGILVFTAPFSIQAIATKANLPEPFLLLKVAARWQWGSFLTGCIRACPSVVFSIQNGLATASKLHPRNRSVQPGNTHFEYVGNEMSFMSDVGSPVWNHERHEKREKGRLSFNRLAR